MDSDSSYYYYTDESDEEDTDHVSVMIMGILRSLIDRVEADIVQENMARILQDDEMKRMLPPYIPPSMRPTMDPCAYDGMTGMAKRNY